MSGIGIGAHHNADVWDRGVSHVRKKIITMEGIVAVVVCGNNQTRHASTKVQCPPLSDRTGEGKKGSFAKTIS